MGNFVGKILHKETRCSENHDDANNKVENQVNVNRKSFRVRFSKSLDKKSSVLVTLNTLRRPTTGKLLKETPTKASDDGENFSFEPATEFNELNCEHEPQLHSRQHQKNSEECSEESSTDIDSSDDEIPDDNRITIKSLEAASSVEVKDHKDEKKSDKNQRKNNEKRLETSIGNQDNQSIEIAKKKFARVLEEYKNITESDVAKSFQEACSEVKIFESLSAAEVFEIISGNEFYQGSSVEMQVKRLQTQAGSNAVEGPFETYQQNTQADEGLNQVQEDYRLQKRIEEALGTRPVEFMNPIVKEKLMKVVEHQKKMTESEVVRAFQGACYELPILNNLTPVEVFKIVQEDMAQNKENLFEDAFNNFLERLQVGNLKF